MTNLRRFSEAVLLSVVASALVSGCGPTSVDVGEVVAAGDAVRGGSKPCRTGSRNCCGNSLCDASETCDSCASDCGACPLPPPPPSGGQGEACNTDGTCDASLVCSAERLCVVINPGSFRFAASSYVVTEGSGELRLFIERVGGSDGAVTVDFRTRTFSGFGDADWASDYQTQDWLTVAFADGELSRSLSVVIRQDTVVEADEWFSLLLGNPTGGATLGTPAAAKVTIADDDQTSPTPDPTPDPTPEPTATGPVKAFPGAVGFGTETRAGRGGQILQVTNLNDSGAGSLRAVLAVAAPRIIVFAVGGEIALSSNLRIQSPFVTIAGQTAPEPGITLTGAGLAIDTHDVLVQHLRIRPGDASSEDSDAIALQNPNAANMYNIVIDHCTLMWAKDENLVFWYGPHDVTISNSLNAEALDRGINVSHGFLLGYNSKKISVLGNAFVSNRVRNPYVQDGAEALLANNLVYNGGKMVITYHDASFIGLAGPPSFVTFENNQFIDGPSSTATNAAIDANNDINPNSRFFLSGNVSTGVVNSVQAWVTTTRPVWIDGLTLIAGTGVKTQVLANAGARPARRDAIDARVMSQIAAGTAGRIPWCAEQQLGNTSCDEPGEYLYPAGTLPRLTPSARAFTVPASPHGDDDGDGYTNIEEVLHQMAIAVEEP